MPTNKKQSQSGYIKKKWKSLAQEAKPSSAYDSEWGFAAQYFGRSENSAEKNAHYPRMDFLLG